MGNDARGKETKLGGKELRAMLWKHEADRVFGDRMNDAVDQEDSLNAWVNKEIKDVFELDLAKKTHGMAKIVFSQIE